MVSGLVCCLGKIGLGIGIGGKNKETNFLFLMIPKPIFINISTETSLHQIYFNWNWSFYVLSINIFNVNNITFLFLHICTVFTFHKKNKRGIQALCYIENNWSCLAFIRQNKQIKTHQLFFSLFFSRKIIVAKA